jgi:hypothetical protein
MHQRCTTLDERGSSVADLFPSWERLSEEKRREPKPQCGSQVQRCHAERSEASHCPSSETLRYAQGDIVSQLRLMPIRADQSAVCMINDSVGKCNFAGMRHLSQARKVVDTPHLRGENHLFQSIFPSFCISQQSHKSAPTAGCASPTYQRLCATHLHPRD